MAWTTPRTWVTGEIVTAAEMNSNVRDNTLWLYGGSSGRVTTSALSGGPPASPADGDIWIATGVDGGGGRWAFQYDAAWATDIYKWKFIGGREINTGVDGSMVYAGSSWSALTSGPQVTIVRAGVYDFKYGIIMITNTGTAVTSGAAALYDGSTVFTAAAPCQINAGTTNVGGGVSTATSRICSSPVTISMVVAALSSTTWTFQYGWILAIPQRII